MNKYESWDLMLKEDKLNAWIDFYRQSDPVFSEAHSYVEAFSRLTPLTEEQKFKFISVVYARAKQEYMEDMRDIPFSTLDSSMLNEHA